MSDHYETRPATRERVLALFESHQHSETPFILSITGGGMQMQAHLNADDLLQLEALLISARQRRETPARAAA